MRVTKLIVKMFRVPASGFFLLLAALFAATLAHAMVESRSSIWDEMFLLTVPVLALLTGVLKLPQAKQKK